MFEYATSPRVGFDFYQNFSFRSIRGGVVVKNDDFLFCCEPAVFEYATAGTQLSLISSFDAEMKNDDFFIFLGGGTRRVLVRI